MFFETFGVSHQTKYIHIETKFASHKHHLFSLLTSRNVRKTQADQSIPHIFYFARKETTHKPSKWQQQKHFSPVCMLLVQFASMNVFYSMWQLEDIIFHESLSLLWDCFNHHVVVLTTMSLLSLRASFEGRMYFMRYLLNNSTILCCTKVPN